MPNAFYFHRGWRFRLANRFPLEDAFAACRDHAGREVYDPAYCDDSWQQVTLPHTFNDAELFSVPIEDAGSGQTRTVAFYRNVLDIPPEHRGIGR